jgi:hypothetical protein
MGRLRQWMVYGYVCGALAEACRGADVGWIGSIAVVALYLGALNRLAPDESGIV